MELTEAYTVARAIADCYDPPVTEGIFSSLNEAFPYLHFELTNELDKVKVTDTSKGIPVVIKDPDDHTL